MSVRDWNHESVQHRRWNGQRGEGGGVQVPPHFLLFSEKAVNIITIYAYIAQGFERHNPDWLHLRDA